MNAALVDTYKGNILVVDDSPDNLRVLSASLSTLGYKVRCVTNGKMALVSVESCPPDLILLDIRMPALDGYEVCQRLKSNPGTADIPIIFLSALDDVLDKVKAFEMGGADYVTKLFQAGEILAGIAHQLTIQRLQDQLTQQNQPLQQEIEAHRRTTAALQDAKEIAEINSRAKGNFIARMSHELRTPLNSILGFSSLMISHLSLTKEHQEYVASIHTSARHLLKMINQVLAVTRDKATPIALNQQNFNLHALPAEIVSDWRLQAEKQGLQFNFMVDLQVPQYIYSDDDKLRQVLIQLLKNAIQFTGAETAEALMAEALDQGLPLDWAIRLHRAAMQGFDQQIAALIQQIPEGYQRLTQGLSDWNKNFQFDPIVAITQRILDRSR